MSGRWCAGDQYDVGVPRRREAGVRRPRRAVVLAVVRAYRESMQRFAGMQNLEVWYSRLNAAQLQTWLRQQDDTKTAKSVASGTAKPGRRTA
jgi:hypothetical protein